MIKAHGVDGQGRPVLFLGLSHENLSRLVADEPIVVDPAELGVDGPRICIFAGKTEDDMVAHIKAAGVRIHEERDSR